MTLTLREISNDVEQEEISNDYPDTVDLVVWRLKPGGVIGIISLCNLDEGNKKYT
jgi:hypothetical protein